MPEGSIKIKNIGDTVEITFDGAGPGDTMRAVLTSSQARESAHALHWAAVSAETAAAKAAHEKAAGDRERAARMRAEADKLDGGAA